MLTLREIKRRVSLISRAGQIITLFLALVGLIAIGGLISGWFKSGNNLIPSRITQQANFTIFYPQKNQPSPVKVQSSSLIYSTPNQAISFQALVNGKPVVVSEQATPEAFNQPGVYQFKLEQAKQYDSFNSRAGEVNLTRPTDLAGQTVAWVNADNTLTLARALQPLNQTDWQALFNNLIKVN